MEENLEVDKYWIMTLIAKIDKLEKIIVSISQEQQKSRKKYLSINEVAEQFGVSRKWVDARKDKIGFINLGGTYRFRVQDVEEYAYFGYFKDAENLIPWCYPEKRKAKRK